MEKRNAEIRSLIDSSGLMYWQVAEAVGISESTFSVWLRHELSDDRRKKVIQAINLLTEAK